MKGSYGPSSYAMVRSLIKPRLLSFQRNRSYLQTSETEAIFHDYFVFDFVDYYVFSFDMKVDFKLWQLFKRFTPGQSETNTKSESYDYFA